MPVPHWEATFFDFKYKSYTGCLKKKDSEVYFKGRQRVISNDLPRRIALGWSFKSRGWAGTATSTCTWYRQKSSVTTFRKSLFFCSLKWGMCAERLEPVETWSPVQDASIGILKSPDTLRETSRRDPKCWLHWWGVANQFFSFFCNFSETFACFSCFPWHLGANGA